MPSQEVVSEEETWITEIGRLLHGLCQPLTALNCRLELGLMEHEPEAMQAAMTDSLRECERMNKTVYAMQFALRTAMEQS